MKPSEIVDTMLTEIIPDESRWCKNTMWDLLGPHPRYCLLGALNMAVARSPLTTEVERSNNPLWQQTRNAILGQIQQRIHGGPPSLIGFNDSWLRTYGDVREVLEKTRAGLQEQGN